jgi:hypothetical protein
MPDLLCDVAKYRLCLMNIVSNVRVEKLEPTFSPATTHSASRSTASLRRMAFSISLVRITSSSVVLKKWQGWILAYDDVRSLTGHTHRPSP